MYKQNHGYETCRKHLVMGSGGNLKSVGGPHSMKVLNKGPGRTLTGNGMCFVEIWKHYSGREVSE